MRWCSVISLYEESSGFFISSSDPSELINAFCWSEDPSLPLEDHRTTSIVRELLRRIAFSDNIMLFGVPIFLSGGQYTIGPIRKSKQRKRLLERFGTYSRWLKGEVYD